MSKWRPASASGIYVITDIHGRINELQNICNRILPLRKSSKIVDRIVFLGDYIDRKTTSDKVIDYILSLKKKYGDQIVCLMGNHEWFLLLAIDLMRDIKYSNFEMFNIWRENGGLATIFGYLNRMNLSIAPTALPRHRVIDIIPKEHIKFFTSLLPYYRFDNYIFVHAGCDPEKNIENQDYERLFLDNELYSRALISLADKCQPQWNNIYVTGHHCRINESPIIMDNYYMLDCGMNKLICLELSSKEAFVANAGKSKLVRFVPLNP